MDDDLIDVRQAALEAGRSTETIRRWIWSGRLPASMRKHRLMINRARLRAIVQEDSRAVARSLKDWIKDLEARPTYAGAPVRSSSSDLVLEDRRDHSPRAPIRARR